MPLAHKLNTRTLHGFYSSTIIIQYYIGETGGSIYPGGLEWAGGWVGGQKASELLWLAGWVAFFFASLLCLVVALPAKAALPYFPGNKKTTKSQYSKCSSSKNIYTVYIPVLVL